MAYTDYHAQTDWSGFTQTVYDYHAQTDWTIETESTVTQSVNAMALLGAGPTGDDQYDTTVPST